MHLPKEEGRSREEIESEARKAALREILDREGIGGAIVLASNTKHPGLVLNPLLEIIDDVDATWDLLDRRHEFPDSITYLALISIIALNRFGQAWRDRIEHSFLERRWSDTEKAALLSRWPFEATTWELAEAQEGPVADVYWRTCWTRLRSLNERDLRHTVDRTPGSGPCVRAAV